MYHVDLALSDVEVQELKSIALSRKVTVRELVTTLVKSALYRERRKRSVTAETNAGQKK